MNYCKLNYYNYNKGYDELKEIGIKIVRVIILMI